MEKYDRARDGVLNHGEGLSKACLNKRTAYITNAVPLKMWIRLLNLDKVCQVISHPGGGFAYPTVIALEKGSFYKAAIGKKLERLYYRRHLLSIG